MKLAKHFMVEPGTKVHLSKLETADTLGHKKNTDALDRNVKRLAELQQSVFSSQDAQEGALAFVEKRPPVWQGR